MSKRPVTNKMCASSQPSIKRSKSDTKHEQTLLGLHFDCLVSVFQWLNLKDLLSIAQTNRNFAEPVHCIIAKRHAKDLIKITFDKYDLETREDVLLLQGMSIVIAFLRYFGHSITNLFVRFDRSKPIQCLAVEMSILKFCKGLKRLVLEGCRRGAFDDISTSFKELEVFTFRNGYLGQNISQFNKWFPKLRLLTILFARVANGSCIEVTMPFLEHLDIKIEMATKTFTRFNIREAIRQNPQLRSVYVNDDFKHSELRFANCLLKQLEKLELRQYLDNVNCDKRIVFRKVKELILDIKDDDSQLEHDDSNSAIHLAFKKLEVLEVRCHNLHSKWFNFAWKNNLKKLTLFSRNDGPSIHFLMKAASNWPELMELTVQVDRLSVDDIVTFINACKHLKRLNISDVSIDLNREFNEVNSKLKNEWELVPMITKCHSYYFEHSIIRKS